ncbi:hypothetical protein EYC84_006780 [Monilinia fructicola]|uniref:Uncharacterized protein n=1 Tax=Monilinia fructicola TaxID=38448 RepID=A0A5M9KCN1_MONFR|nr:hypothetical protein EYC84_006780 [Monilinia fructicola]
MILCFASTWAHSQMLILDFQPTTYFTEAPAMSDGSLLHVETVNHCNAVITAKTINTYLIHSPALFLPQTSPYLNIFTVKKRRKERNRYTSSEGKLVKFYGKVVHLFFGKSLATPQIRTPPPLNEVKFVQSFIDQVKQSKAYRDPFLFSLLNAMISLCTRSDFGIEQLPCTCAL